MEVLHAVGFWEKNSFQFVQNLLCLGRLGLFCKWFGCFGSIGNVSLLMYVLTFVMIVEESEIVMAVKSSFIFIKKCK